MPAFPSPSTAMLGFGGTLLTAFGAAGAGSTLVEDDMLRGTPFEALRYGHGRMLATGCVYAGVLVLAVAWVRLRQEDGKVLPTAGLWALPMLVSPPLFSRDLYNYLAQGALAARGHDPYTTGSSQLPLALHENMHHLWEDTPTPYGPLHILLTKAVASIAGENVVVGVLLIRLVFAAGLVLLVAALPGLCRALGTDTRFALWFAAANPLVLVLVLGGGHNDMLAIGLLAAGTLFVVRDKDFAGLALLALAVAVKVTMLVAVPFLLWIVARRVGLVGAIGRALAAMVPAFLAVTLLAGHGFGWVRGLGVTSLIENWMSLPTALGELIGRGMGLDGTDQELLISCMRTAGMAMLAVLVTLLWWRSRSGRPRVVLWNATLALALCAVLLPATLPWYFCWAITLGAVLPWSRPRLALACGGAVWLVVCDYPTGEAAIYDWDYVGVTLAAAALIGAAAAFPDKPRVEAIA